MKLLIALAVQRLVLHQIYYLSDNCEKELKLFEVEDPSYKLFKEDEFYLPTILKRKAQKMFKLKVSPSPHQIFKKYKVKI